jgi:hypothetical protein
MIKTQHCPNCEATKQELSDFRQKVSDVVVDTEEKYNAAIIRDNFGQFIIPAPKRDPLVDVANSLGFYNTAAKHWASDVRAALDALGFEIREKNDDQ